MRVLGVALAVSVVTGVVFGLIPALTASDERLASALHEEGRSGGSGARSRRVRATLVVAELALSVVLLVGAGLLLVSFQRVLDVSPGFEPQHVVVAQIARSGSTPEVLRFYDQLLERVRALPAVEAAALGTPPPLSGLDGRVGFQIEGRTGQSPIPVRARPRIVTPAYFTTLGIPLVRGRVVTDRDVESAPAVVIINAAAARLYWPNENPIGKRITFAYGVRVEPQWIEIVGVVGDVKHAGLEADTDPEAYLPYRQTFIPGMVQRLSVVLRTHARLSTIAPALRAATIEIDRNQPVGTISAMEDLLADSVAPRRLNLWLVAAFAVVALVLTAAGLYGVMSYLVAQRTHEIGMRMALGASRADVLRLVLRQAGAMTLAGIAIGLVGSLALTRLLTTLLFGVSATNPLVYGGVALLLAVVALVAVAIPSSRATRVDPLTALR
jgi:predicted permease